MDKHNLIENELLIVNKQTFDVFLKQDNPAELMSLYMFYYYTAKWQGTNQIRCTTGYVANGLRWSEAKVRKVKKQLLELGLIEDVNTRDQFGKMTGHYIKMNYVFKKETIEKISHPHDFPQGGNEASHPHDFPQGGQVHTMENHRTNALSSYKLNALSSDREKERYARARNVATKVAPSLSQETKKKFIKPTIEEIREYCQDKNYDVDAEQFINYYDACGWEIKKGQKMKDWKAAVNGWVIRQKKWAKEKQQPKPQRTNAFANFEQRNWDFAKIEQLMQEDNDEPNDGITTNFKPEPIPQSDNSFINNLRNDYSRKGYTNATTKQFT